MHKSQRHEASGRQRLVMQDDQVRPQLEDLYRKDKQNTESEIERMKKAATIETEVVRIKGEKNRTQAVEKIVGYVTME